MPFRARMYIGSSVTSAPSSSTRPESGAVSPTDHRERRRLAGAVRPEQSDDFAGRNVEVDALDDRAAAVRLRQIARPQRRHSVAPRWARDTSLTIDRLPGRLDVVDCAPELE